MQRARRPLPDHHQRHEGRSPGARLRRGPPRTDPAAELRVCAVAASHLRERSGPVSPAHPGRCSGLCWVPARAASLRGSDAPCSLPDRCPTGWPHLLSPGAQGPASKFSIVCCWTERLRPAEAGCLGRHLIPPGTGRGSLPRRWGGSRGSARLREGARGLRDWEGSLPHPPWLSGPPWRGKRGSEQIRN